MNITEASGLAASRLHPGLLYVVNDHGGASGIYVIDDVGNSRASIQLRHIDPCDVEDIAVGRCDSGKENTCIYIGK